MKTKKPKLKTNKEFKIDLLKSQIESEKTALDRYVKVMVRSAFIECCTGGAYFNKMYLDMLKNGFEAVRNSKKSKKEQDKLQYDWFFGHFKQQTEIEGLEHTLKYYKRLVGWAKYELNGLDNKKKEKIVKDCIEQEDLWSEQFNRNSKLYKELKPIQKTNLKPKTKGIEKKPVKRRKTTSRKIKR